jgi:hypothetical protein
MLPAAATVNQNFYLELTEIPAQRPPRLNAHFLPGILPAPEPTFINTMDDATRERQLQRVLDDLNTQLKPNYGRTADKYKGVERTTL